MPWDLITNLKGGPGPAGPAGPDWFKGTLTSTSNLDGIANGLYLVPSPTVANALVLPGGAAGLLETFKDGTGVGKQTFKTFGAVELASVRRRTSSGWQEWGAQGQRPIRLITAVHGNFTWDALPDGRYYNDQATLQSLWELPVQVGLIQKDTHSVGYGTATMREWAPPYRVWINQRTTSGWQGWQIDNAGGGGSGVSIGTLTAQTDMNTLGNGWWDAPNAGVAQSLLLPGNLPGFLLQSGDRRQYTNSKGVYVQSKNTSGVWGTWYQAGVVDGYTPLQPPTGLPWMQEDTTGSSIMLLDQDHHGAGYAINTQNWPGAGTAWVIHQYSNEAPAMIIDNCRSQAAIQINNTRNTSITPDYKGDGPFFKLGPWDDSEPFPGQNYSRWLTLGNDLVFRNDTRQRMGFQQVFDSGDILQFWKQGGGLSSAVTQVGWAQKSANGTLWQLVISDTGSVSAVAV